MQKTRAERLMENAEGMDAVVIANDGEPFLDSAFWYITEQSSGTFEGSFAIVGPNGLDVIVSILEEEGAHEGKGNVHVYHDRKERDQFIKDALKGCTKVGFNVSNVSYAAAEYVRKTAEIEIVNATKAIGDTVSVKDAKEIEATRKACAISSKVAGEIPDMLSEGVSEKEVASRMDNRMRELGGTAESLSSCTTAYSSPLFRTRASVRTYDLQSSISASMDSLVNGKSTSCRDTSLQCMPRRLHRGYITCGRKPASLRGPGPIDQHHHFIEAINEEA